MGGSAGGNAVRFRAVIYRVGPNYCVDVPEPAGRAFAGAGPHPNVEGEAEGAAFRTRLAPRGGGAWRLFLNGEARSGAGAGDAVEVTLRRDRAPREPALPADLARALRAVPGGLEAFASLTEAQRAGMVAFVGRARTAATRARYVARVAAEARRRAGG